jgi:hypothetical protein
MYIQLQYNVRCPLLTPVVLIVIFIIKICNISFIIYVVSDGVFVLILSVRLFLALSLPDHTYALQKVQTYAYITSCTPINCDEYF